jgi:hypothetical protein
VFLARRPLCVACMEWSRVTPARVVDHVVPHRGDTRLFWDESNWQALCKPCHDFKTATEDGGMGSAAVRPESLRPSRIPLTVVAGPPGAGKSTWVRGRAGARDLVLDLDEIRSRLSGLPLYAAGDEWRAKALRWRNAHLSRLSLGDVPWSRAWLVVSAPHPADRHYWRERGGARVVVLETPLAECLRRIGVDARRGDKASHHAAVARTWWATYRRDALDDVAVQT